MRPRQMPRNFLAGGRARVRPVAASMRPRQMPRNFVAGRGAYQSAAFASMRPRQMPRNFGDERGRQIRDPAGFNEAAADAAEFSRASLSFRVVIDSASMRP